MAILTQVSKLQIAEEILNLSKQLQSLETQKTSLVNKITDIKKTVDESEDFTADDKVEVSAEVAKTK